MPSIILYKDANFGGENHAFGYPVALIQGRCRRLDRSDHDARRQAVGHEELRLVGVLELAGWSARSPASPWSTLASSPCSRT